VCNAAPQQQQSPAQYNYQNYLASQTTTTPAPPVHPPATIHYVNIGQELNGEYKYGYDTGKGPSGQSFREETRLPDGSVKGQYGYLDAQNKMRIVKYTAGLNGFSIDSDTALNEQQIAASRPTAPNPQYQGPQYQSPQYQAPQAVQPAASQTTRARQSFQGLDQAASTYATQPQYAQPAPQAAALQAPYSGYQAQQAPAQLPNYNANAYDSSAQLTPSQLQQQALAAARQRQAALARQAQQEEIIRQQQRAQTEAILASQRAALEQEKQQQQQQPSAYQNLAQQYSQYAPQPAPQPQPRPQPQPQYQAPAAPTYQSPASYQPASQPSYAPSQRTTELKPDVLSNFIQLPGVRLIQIDKPQPQKRQNSLLSPNEKQAEDEYTGPVVINAALLNYDIGAQAVGRQDKSSNKKA